MTEVRPAAATLPAMGELNVLSHLIGDQEGLRRAWERDGYWRAPYRCHRAGCASRATQGSAPAARTVLEQGDIS